MKKLLASLGGSVNPHDEEIKALLQRSAETDRLSDYLRAIIDDEEWLEEVAARSFPHPLGFYKIVLETHPCGAKLRLHAWTDRFHEAVLSDIHDHFWDYSSIAIAGAIDSIDYTVECQRGLGEDYYHYRLHPRSDGEYEQEFVGRVTLTSEHRETSQVGTLSSRNSRNIHKVVPATSQVCATLMVQSAPNHEVNNIYSHTPPEVSNKVVAENPFDTGELALLLRLVVATILGRSPC